jgi:4-hydroxy-3-methylbut-2-enyl diphosphate reductase
VHRVAASLVEQGYQVVVLGDIGHTEVRGIMSVAGPDAIALSKVEELGTRQLGKRVGIVSQTTQTVDRFRHLVSEVASHAYEVRAYNTICNATSERQAAALATTAEVEAMVVVGGKNSANTNRLAEICAESGIPTYHVETSAEVDSAWFVGMTRVGVTAGASTPDWIIEEVIDRVAGI